VIFSVVNVKMLRKSGLSFIGKSTRHFLQPVESAKKNHPPIGEWRRLAVAVKIELAIG
jgi:hypothetical protein